jgi:antitoxin component YwqK of YwqJK toxin-antitoxin module
MAKAILLFIALLCAACAGTSAQQVAAPELTSQYFNTLGCKYIFETPAELATELAEAVADEDLYGDIIVVCLVDNGTFSQMEYYVDEETFQYGAYYTFDENGVLRSKGRMDVFAKESMTLFDSAGQELAEIGYYNGIPVWVECGDGKTLTPDEIISWIRSDKLGCSVNPQTLTLTRNIRADVCQYSGYSTPTNIDKVTGEPLNGTLCESDGFGDSVETQYKDGKKDGAMRIYHQNILSYEIIYKDDVLVLFTEYYSDRPYWKFEVPYKNYKKDGLAKAYGAGGMPLFDVFYEADIATRGNCANGKTLSVEQLQNIEDEDCKEQ